MTKKAETGSVPAVAPKAPAKPSAPSVPVSTGEKILGILGYLGYFCILPIVLRPDSKFCQLHGHQGLVIMLLFFLLSWLGWMSSMAASFLFVLHFSVALVGVIQAARGVAFKFPGIYEVVKELKLRS